MFKCNSNILTVDMSMADPTIHLWWRGFPRVVVTLTVWSLVFLAATLIQGDSITTTQCVCIRQYSLKNHSGDPVVASGYFVDSVCVCVSLSVDVHLLLLSECWCTSGINFEVYVSCFHVISCLFNTTYFKRMCYLLSLYKYITCMQILTLLSPLCECCL